MRENSTSGLFAKQWAGLKDTDKDPRVSNSRMPFPHLPLKGSREGAVMEPGESSSEGEGHRPEPWMCVGEYSH